ncbi:arylamine N-acetyltransferase [Streptomyces sp. NPDC005805]|uniref:arylamine N-acetyltransferase family protein n=1 Tax=Streptomyces sp. NPDC005805 TaxID=3157068 RepID=UPI0033D1B8C3
MGTIEERRGRADGLSAEAVDAYLRRIGAARPERADGAALRELQVRHLLSVPFENLSVHRREEVVLEEERLVAKIVERHRGGFCYELNGAFAALLRALGFGVTLHQARVFGRDGALGVPYDHLALRVETADGTGPWLADVGFGDHSRWPLLLDARSDQEDPAGVFRVVDGPGHGDLDLLRGGVPQFRLDTRPRALAEFEVGSWYHRTCPASHFTASLVCSRLTEEGRITLSGRKLVTTVRGERSERLLESDREVLDAYREHFGLEPGTVPEVAEFALTGPVAV